MKRSKNLFEKICGIQNLHDACYKAARHKRRSLEYLCFREKLEPKLEDVRQELLNGSYRAGEYRQFKISDPKERIISAAPFKDRVIHHAIINVLEPVFERQMIYHTYACRKGKGTHAAARHAFRMAKKYRYFLKLDVRKYFDSINHTVLNKQLCRIIKDERCLCLLFTVIDSYCTDENRGLPIGNLTSQFFANLYLSPLDHYILEELKPCAYVRYMDDMILFDDSMDRLKSMYGIISLFCRERLFLQLKQPSFGKTGQGVPFLGWRLSSTGIRLLGKTKRRMKVKVREIIMDYQNNVADEEKTLARIQSVNSARKLRIMN